MTLILPDSSHLGDKRLDEVESVAQAKETNAKLAAANRIADQDVLEDKAAALGRPLAPSDFITRIQKLDKQHKMVVRQGGVKGAVAVYKVLPKADTEGNQLKYVSGFFVDTPAIPEFSAVVTDQRGLPWREIRGWRTVLKALVSNGIFTINQVKTEFGPVMGRRGVLWEKWEHATNAAPQQKLITGE